MRVKRMAIMLGITGVILGAVFGFVAFRNHMIKQYFATMPKPVVTVTAAQSSLETWESRISGVGTLSAVNGVDVTTAVAGLVKEIAFQSGQKVRKGDLLVRLDTDVEVADLKSAKAEAALAKLTADRKRSLLPSATVAQAAVDQADADLRVKEAKVAAMAATIQRKTVLAPFEGVLGQRRVDMGQFLQPGASVVNLQDLSVMLADFNVSQKDLGQLSVGQPLNLTVDAYPDRTFPGIISTIEPMVDAKSGMVAIQAKLPNDDGLLRPGMFARVDVVVPGSKPVVVVPVSAISYALHGDTVFVIRPAADGTKQVERAVVQPGERRQGRVAILAGLKPGEQVVTSGQLKLDNGAKVTVAEGEYLAAPTVTATE